MVGGILLIATSWVTSFRWPTEWEKALYKSSSSNFLLENLVVFLQKSMTMERSFGPFLFLSAETIVSPQASELLKSVGRPEAWNFNEHWILQKCDLLRVFAFMVDRCEEAKGLFGSKWLWVWDFSWRWRNVFGCVCSDFPSTRTSLGFSLA